VPIIAFVVFAESRLISVLNQERMRNDANMLYAMMHSTDAIIKNLDDLNLHFFFGQHLNHFVLKNEMSMALNSIQFLSSVVNSNRFIYEIAFYFIDDDFIYTSRGSYSVRLFHRYGFVFSNWNESEFLTDANNIRHTLVRPSEEVVRHGSNRLNLVTFIYPFRIQYGQIEAIIMFMVEENIFNSSYNADEPIDTYTVRFVLDERNNIIASSASELNTQQYDFLAFDFDALFEEERMAHNVYSISGEYFLTTSILSPATGWRYVSFTPMSSVVSITSGLRNEMLVMLLAIISVAFVVIYISIRSNYSPFAKLSRLAASIYHSGRNLNEIEIVRETMQYLDSKDLKLMKSASKASEEFVFRKLLFGFLGDEQEVMRFMSDFNIKFDYDSFCVVHVDFGDGDVKHFAQLVKYSLKPPLHGYVVAGDSGQKHILVILNFDSVQIPCFAALVLEFHGILVKADALPVSFGVGNICGSLSGISESFKEACLASEYRFTKGRSKVIFINEVDGTNYEISPHLFSDLEKLKLYMHQGDAVRTEAILMGLLNYIKQDDMSAFEAHRVCHDIFNAIIKVAINPEIDCKVDHDYLLGIIKQLEHSTADEVIADVLDICTGICTHVLNKKQSEVQISRIEQINAYIRANYTDVNFSIQTLADSLDMGVTNLSQYFKKKTGRALIECITELRMERAKNLLKLQKYKLDEISGMTGYLNTSSFIRRFKQYYGVTPGQYAKDILEDDKKDNEIL